MYATKLDTCCTWTILLRVTGIPRHIVPDRVSCEKDTFFLVSRVSMIAAVKPSLEKISSRGRGWAFGTASNRKSAGSRQDKAGSLEAWIASERFMTVKMMIIVINSGKSRKFWKSYRTVR